jgi:hypothetical protein
MPAARSEPRWLRAAVVYIAGREMNDSGRWTVTVNVVRAGTPAGGRQFAVVAK